ARELGIAIGEPACWGRGYGSEALRLVLDYAFRELEVHRVQLSVFETNTRARAAYLKVGFVEEGRLREAAFVDGRRVDVFLLSILAREWLGAKR
ncbi:MAG: N-acetyltransferase, partial [Planctomycetota bacterium]